LLQELATVVVARATSSATMRVWEQDSVVVRREMRWKR